MRETCARALAAALMTGAIATVVGMPALFGMPSEGSRPIAAPPSSLQRTVRLTAHLAPPRHRPSPARLVTAHTNVQSHGVASASVIRTRPARKAGARRQLAGVEKPKPVVVTPAPDPPAPAPAPVPEEDQGNGHGHGHGHAYGHDKQDE